MSLGAITIAKRELKSLIVSPILYVVGGIYALLLGYQFLQSLIFFDAQLQQAKVQAQLMKNPDALQGISLNELLIGAVINFGFFLLLFSVPAITMRLLSEEKNQGTYELLATSPLSSWELVLGKFLAGVGFIVLLLVTHALFLGIMFGYGNPEVLPVISGYIGFILGGAALVAVGLFSSSLTRIQIVAYFIGLFINIVLLQLANGARSTSGNLSEFLSKASITMNFEQFNRGIVSVSGVVYFVTLTIFFLAATRIAVQSMKR